MDFIKKHFLVIFLVGLILLDMAGGMLTARNNQLKLQLILDNQERIKENQETLRMLKGAIKENQEELIRLKKLGTKENR